MRDEDRRKFVLGAGGLALGAGTALLLSGCAKVAEATPATPTSGERGGPRAGEEEDVSPPEDLMREHGVLNRILLVYDESTRRLGSQAEAPTDAIAGAADIIRRFIEQYHEKLEEDFVFPRFEKANKLVDLVATLRRQHQTGRGLTDTILRLATPASAKDPAARRKLSEALQLFVRMYRPHEAREDTVLFPAFRSVVTPKEFDALGDQFEDKEHELFGKAGFEGIVEEVAKIERALGVYDLNQFTPSTP
jgi:hemerythrin-like domain-containing protein